MKPEMGCAFMALSLALSGQAMAQPNSGWAKFGRALAGPQESPLAPLVSTNSTGTDAAKTYSLCMQNSAVKAAQAGETPYNAARIGKAACVRERSEFYSGVVQDQESTGKSRSHAIIYANETLRLYDMDVDAALPGIAAQSRNKTPVGSGDKYDRLAKLRMLLTSGAVTAAEYESEKQKILSED